MITSDVKDKWEREGKRGGNCDQSLFLEGSVFRAKDKRSETVGAAEVQEDGRVMVDLPIDQVKTNLHDLQYL